MVLILVVPIIGLAVVLGAIRIVLLQAPLSAARLRADECPGGGALGAPARVAT